MKKYNIVYFSMSRYGDWQSSGVVNRNYHLLHTLAKSERVNSIITVDFLPFNLARAIKSFIKDFIFGKCRGELILKTLTSRACKINDKITVYSTVNSVLRPAEIINDLKKVIEDLKMGDDLIVINSNPLYTDYLGNLGQQVSIFDAVDNWAEHSSYAKYKDLLMKHYAELSDKSNLFYTVSEELAETFKGQNTRWLPNAVDFDHYQNKETHSSIANLKKPILGFLGILQDRIDVELIKSIAKSFPDYSLVLAGPIWKDFPTDELKIFNNIYFTGPVRYEDIPKMYAGFDLGLILYKDNAFVKSTNSMKYYEYLAAGLPVVSTNSGGIEKFKDVIYIANSHPEFILQIQSALIENSDQKRQQRKDFVKPMSWTARVNSMISDLDQITGQ